mmetsp:Transcript_23817/g.76553  ORF Transcript_23817/g.76553 Transcript_23817/m.76553 type:complete len:89 (+) Transcript_23817:80-346(+)
MMSVVFWRGLSVLSPPAFFGTALRWSSNAGKRFRLTGSGRIKRKAMGTNHNTGGKRPRVTQRKRGITELVATNNIRNKVKKMLQGRPR